MKAVGASLALLSPFLLLALFFGARSRIRSARRDRYIVPEGLARWHGVDREARRLRRNSAIWGVLLGARRALVASGVIVVPVVVTLDVVHLVPLRTDLWRITGAASLVLGGFALTPVIRARRDPLYSGELFEIDPRSDERASGDGVRLLARLLFIPVYLFFAGSAVVWFLVVGYLAEDYGDVSPAVAVGADSVIYLFFLLLVCLYALIPLALDRYGLRLLTEDARAALHRDPRPPILYLRNFGDDGFRIQASGASRRGLLGKLSIRRSRRFEEVLAWRLNRYGPLVAVNDPRLRLATLGAAKMSLAPENWKQIVEAQAEVSLAVVVSAAPESVRPGLRWELEMLAERLGHQRIVLILPPRDRTGSLAGWSDFCDAVSAWRFYDGAVELNPTGAAHVLTHLPDEGWHAWGASTHTEWTYTACVKRALDHVAAHAGVPTERPGPAARPLPRAVRVSVGLMGAGMVTTAIDAALTVTRLRRDIPVQNAAMKQLNPASYGGDLVSPAATHISWVLIGAAVAEVLWTWTIWRCRAGRHGARNQSLILFVLGGTAVLIKFAVDASSTRGLDAAVVLLGLGATALLWVRASARYFGLLPRSTDREDR